MSKFTQKNGEASLEGGVLMLGWSDKVEVVEQHGLGLSDPEND